MRIVRQSDDELLISSPATNSRLAAAVLIAVGAVLLLLSASLALASLGIPIMARPPGTAGTKVFEVAFLLVIALFFGVPGIISYRRALDTTYQFDGEAGRLLVRSAHSERVISFGRVLRAELQHESDEGTAVYGLCLVLEAPPSRLQMTDFLTQERSKKEALAGQINAFLDRHRSASYPPR